MPKLAVPQLHWRTHLTQISNNRLQLFNSPTLLKVPQNSSLQCTSPPKHQHLVVPQINGSSFHTYLPSQRHPFGNLIHPPPWLAHYLEQMPLPSITHSLILAFQQHLPQQHRHYLLVCVTITHVLSFHVSMQLLLFTWHVVLYTTVILELKLTHM